jgi:hypothetical protein
MVLQLQELERSIFEDTGKTSGLNRFITHWLMADSIYMVLYS